jgi:serine/threonine protein kinase
MVETDENGNQHIVLIDFGFATKFLDENGSHVSDIELKDTFRGNILFCSLDQMEFKVTSRKDDLISLIYMLLFILNDFALPGITDETFR